MHCHLILMLIRNTIVNDYLPARMLNEFTYCPRLFFYEHVEGVFAHNLDTVEGAIRHSRVDAAVDDFPDPTDIVEDSARIKARGLMLSSEALQLIAKMDLVESKDGVVVPVDYKRGKPKEFGETGVEAWEPDQIQLGVQALVLRENGYRCDYAVVYYATTKQRVRVAITDELVNRCLAAATEARQLIRSGEIPAPLVDSPKCPRCSLVNICLPDETHKTRNAETRPDSEQALLFDVGPIPTASSEVSSPLEATPLRRLIAARDDLRPLYLNQQGLSVGKSGDVLQVRERKELIQEVRIHEISQLNLMGNIQLTTQAVQSLCEHEVPIAYFSNGGWFYGITAGLGLKNIQLRREQFRWADSPTFCLRVSKAIVAGKIKNQRTLLQRNHMDPPAQALALMKALSDQAHTAETLDELMGIEGSAARIYFQEFSGMIKTRGTDKDTAFESTGDNNDEEGFVAELRHRKEQKPFSFDFSCRNRRPPRDPVNAMLSLGYSLLTKDMSIVCQMVGFDPFLGFLHQPRCGRAALSLDLMEPFRPLICDSAVLTAINTGMVTERHFIRTGPAVALTPDGRKAFFRAYEQRMDTLVTHPSFGYRVSYRRMLEIQTRLLARVLTGEVGVYTVFLTR
jgi:CRISPR-associated protein Cas1